MHFTINDTIFAKGTTKTKGGHCCININSNHPSKIFDYRIIYLFISFFRTYKATRQ